MKQLGLMLSVALISFNAVAIETVFGSPDCGSWVQQGSLPKKAWLNGYMSGLNVQHQLQELKPNDPLSKINSVEQMAVWMDNYCKKNPLEMVSLGGWILFVELTKK